MADHSSPDYKDLYLKAKEREKQAKECEKQAKEREKQAKECEKQADEREKQAKECEKQADERTRKTTLTELIQHCHVLLSRWMKVGSPSNSTTGKIPLPKGKYCPTRLEHWTDCPKQLSEVYKSVYQYLHPERGQELRLFSSMAELEWFGRHFASDPLSSERQLETYERFGVQFQVHKIISELCKLPAAREEFGLGDGIHFGNHKNSLSENEPMEDEANELPSIRQPRADQFCINRIDGTSTTILATVEYKPPDKLPSATFRMGLRPMDLWKDVVQSNKIPTDQEEKLKYSATRLVCSAIVQEYHLMIQEGLEYSYLTNGLTRVLLRVPRDQPSTLYYFFCDPDSEITPEGKELQQLHHSGSTNPESSSPDSGSSFVLPSSSPPPSPSEGRRVPTRSQTSCAPSEIRSRSQSPSSSGSDTNQAASHKRRISQVTSSPSAQQSGRQQKAGHDQDDHSQRRAAQFCTQRCLLGLQTRNALDALCPNVDRHCLGQTDPTQHPISVEELILSLKTQLDEDIDRCIPLGGCGSYGAPFKLTCMKHGYTVLGKGTTSGLWKEVSREAQVYRVLRRAQGSAVPIFLGTIDLAKIYFLHGAGQIRHMLIMGWGGECTAKMELTQRLRREIHKSNKEIKALGIIHEDPSQDNVLWCEELGRALIIDFHRSTLRCRPAKQRSGDAKRRLRRVQEGDGKRLRAS